MFYLEIRNKIFMDISGVDKRIFLVYDYYIVKIPLENQVLAKHIQIIVQSMIEFPSQSKLL